MFVDVFWVVTANLFCRMSDLRRAAASEYLSEEKQQKMKKSRARSSSEDGSRGSFSRRVSSSHVR